VRVPVKAAAAVASALVVLGALHGVFGTGMGFLTRPPVYARADLGWGTAELPVGLSREGDAWGDILIDPGAVEIARGTIDLGELQDFKDGGETTEGDLSVHRYHLNGVQVALVRKAGDAASPTVTVFRWEHGPWDDSMAGRILRSIELRQPPGQ
jgi:hypothetical protein